MSDPITDQGMETSSSSKAKADSSKVGSKRKAIMSIEDMSDNDDGSDIMYDSDRLLALEEEESDYEFEEYDEAVALQDKFDAEDLPPDAEVSVPWLVVQEKPTDPTRPPVPCSSSTVPTQFHDDDAAMLKYRSFKSFDTVEDFSDHTYTSKSVTKQENASQKWVRAIQQDWRLLEKDMPDTIFVRVYEGRLDLLRAVIVGAAGTPYHDGLFFFDVYFPPEYPDRPPLVNYRAHKLRINPNLYDTGKVCLSLLNTWQGNTDERWTPGKSTMLQVLLSIQALVLNEKPYFNEPGCANSAGTPHGEKRAQGYNERTFILSCRTMLYTLKNPPKYFEDYVLGHFRLRAHAVLAACKAYIEGAPIGCVVEEEQDEGADQVGCVAGGDLQDTKKGEKSSSGTSLFFKSEVGTMAGNLVPVFIKNGARNCEQFICLGDSYRLAAANYTDIFKKDFYKHVEDEAHTQGQAQVQPQAPANFYSNYHYY